MNQELFRNWRRENGKKVKKLKTVKKLPHRFTGSVSGSRRRSLLLVLFLAAGAGSR